MSTSGAGYAHQIDTANASEPRTNLPIPIIPSDTAKHTAPNAVQGSSKTQATTMTAAAPSRGPDRETSGISATRKHRWATRKAARPSTNDGTHHGIASRKSPAAENSSAGISHRRSRAIGWVSAATANSTAVNALTAG